MPVCLRVSVYPVTRQRRLMRFQRFDLDNPRIYENIPEGR